MSSQNPKASTGVGFEPTTFGLVLQPEPSKFSDTKILVPVQKSGLIFNESGKILKKDTFNINGQKLDLVQKYTHTLALMYLIGQNFGGQNFFSVDEIFGNISKVLPDDIFSSGSYFHIHFKRKICFNMSYTSIRHDLNFS